MKMYRIGRCKPTDDLICEVKVIKGREDFVFIGIRDDMGIYTLQADEMYKVVRRYGEIFIYGQDVKVLAQEYERRTKLELEMISKRELLLLQNLAGVQNVLGELK